MLYIGLPRDWSLDKFILLLYIIFYLYSFWLKLSKTCFHKLHVFMFSGQKMHKFTSYLKRECIVLNRFCLETNFSYTCLFSFRNLSLFHLRNRKPAFRGTKLCYIFKILKSDVQFLKNVKFVNIVCLTVLEDVFMQDYYTTKDFELCFEKKRSPHGMQVLRPTECRCQLGTKYSLYVKDEVG